MSKHTKTKQVSSENFIKAKIIRGNRQVREINVKASKRFRVGNDTYIIKPECIRTKIINGKLESVIYYSEGNPNPHDFTPNKNNTYLNKGLSIKEFNTLYGEDLYDMLVKIQSDKKAMYLIILYIFVNVFAVITLISGFF